MNNDYMAWEPAAEYLALPVGYFKKLVDRKLGPKFYRPSPRKTLFRRVDLDAWRENWTAYGSNSNHNHHAA